MQTPGDFCYRTKSGNKLTVSMQGSIGPRVAMHIEPSQPYTEADFIEFENYIAALIGQGLPTGVYRRFAAEDCQIRALSQYFLYGAPSS